MPAPKSKGKGRAASRSKDKWKSKLWYDIMAPDMFNRQKVAETLADDPEKWAVGEIQKLEAQKERLGGYRDELWEAGEFDLVVVGGGVPGGAVRIACRRSVQSTGRIPDTGGTREGA